MDTGMNGRETSFATIIETACRNELQERLHFKPIHSNHPSIESLIAIRIQQTGKIKSDNLCSVIYESVVSIVQFWRSHVRTHHRTKITIRSKT